MDFCAFWHCKGTNFLRQMQIFYAFFSFSVALVQRYSADGNAEWYEERLFECARLLFDVGKEGAVVFGEGYAAAAHHAFGHNEEGVEVYVFEAAGG